MSFICRRCDQEKSDSELSKSGTAPRPACKPCIRDHLNAYRRSNPDSSNEYARARNRALLRLARKHPDEWRALFDEELTKERWDKVLEGAV